MPTSTPALIFSGVSCNQFHGPDKQRCNGTGLPYKEKHADVVALVGTQYLQVLVDQELLKIAEENLKAQQALLDQIQGFYDAGSRAITDLYNQDALTKAAQVSVVRARSAMQNDKSILTHKLSSWIRPSISKLFIRCSIPMF